MVHVVCLCLCSGFPSKRDSGMIFFRYLKKGMEHGYSLGTLMPSNAYQRKKGGEAHRCGFANFISESGPFYLLIKLGIFTISGY